MIISRKYEVQGQLGRGSMGVVYKVRHLSLDTISALKALPPYLMENPELVKRFYREARVLAGLKHPNIVRIIDIDRDDTQHFLYLVMEYIQGQTLSQYLQKKGPLPLTEVLEITRQVAHALKYAHSHDALAKRGA
jgi:eukaryotic-like serine/threonine-protein kinase